MIPSIIILVIVGAVVYYSFNRPKAKKSSGSSSTSTSVAFPPFGEPGEYSFQPREFEGSQYVWKQGKWHKTN